MAVLDISINDLFTVGSVHEGAPSSPIQIVLSKLTLVILNIYGIEAIVLHLFKEVDGAAQSQHFKFYVYRSRNQDVVFDFLSGLLLVFLNKTHTDVSKKVFSDPCFLKPDDLANPVLIIFIFFLLVCCSRFVLDSAEVFGSKVEPDTEG